MSQWAKKHIGNSGKHVKEAEAVAKALSRLGYALDPSNNSDSDQAQFDI